MFVTGLAALALVTLGVSLVVELPDTPRDALAHADSVAADHNSRYTWSGGVLDLDVPRSAYEASMASPVLRAATVFESCPASFVDPDDPFVRAVADHVRSVSGSSDSDLASAAQAFVGSAISYVSDPELFGQSDFWLRPVETLFLHAGDCEDQAVLLASILGALGLRAVLLDYPGHVAVGVALEEGTGFSYRLDDGGYYLCEPTSTLPVGTVPTGASSQIPAVHRPGPLSAAAHAVTGFLSSYRYTVERVLTL